ncbi:hypothetical protein IIC45_01245 [Patescibacteria group bacterium]|nr:hypothetical protein [Patescibacteria group bacterium]
MSHRTRQKVSFAVAVFIILGLSLSLYSTPQLLYAQADGSDVSKRRAELEAELAELEAEITVQQALVGSKQRERVSIERDVAILNAKIDRSRLEIRARNLSIEKLDSEIRGKENTIGGLNEKLDRQKESLAQLIRKTNEIDDFTIIEIVLANENISEFFSDLDSFDVIKRSLNESFYEIAQTKGYTQEQKEALEGKQSEELELRGLQELQKRKIEVQENEKQEILDITKGVEAAYQQVLKSKQKSAAEIRATLFVLRGSAAIPFERALTYANEVSALVGVRPALILGVIAEESNLGENVGTGNWKVDMHPTRDRPIFEDITNRLGLDPDLMPVSRKPWYGWGGAMGPAQFIPSTWILYEDRIGRVSGQVPPSPWDPRTAFIASGLLLSDNGADRGGYYNERLAALRYFAGWRNAEKSSYAFYGDEVMELAEKYQGLIDILSQS